jgi:hypothetical protein
MQRLDVCRPDVCHSSIGASARQQRHQSNQSLPCLTIQPLKLGLQTGEGMHPHNFSICQRWISNGVCQSTLEPHPVILPLLPPQHQYAPT